MIGRKFPLHIDYQAGTVRGPVEVMGRLFAPARGYFYGPPESTVVIGDPQRLRRVAERLRRMGYPLVESPGTES
jgi:hypothetical protein